MQMIGKKRGQKQAWVWRSTNSHKRGKAKNKIRNQGQDQEPEMRNTEQRLGNALATTHRDAILCPEQRHMRGLNTQQKLGNDTGHIRNNQYITEVETGQKPKQNTCVKSKHSHCKPGSARYCASGSSVPEHSHVIS